MTPAQLHRLSENLTVVRARIAAAAQRGGRDAGAVRLVAVAKYVGLPLTRALADLGCLDVGESRPQSLWEKAEALADAPLRWHLIGHLQRNKVRRTLPKMHLLHSADSLRLLQEIDAESARRSDSGKTCAADVLIEINISGDAAKTGLTPSAARRLLDDAAALKQVRVRGLMAMAGREGDIAAARREFIALRELRDAWRGQLQDATALEELSMGMSGDFEAAVEEGATLVRVGSALFEGIEDLSA